MIGTAFYYILAALLSIVGGSLIIAGQYLYKEKFIKSGFREGLHNTSVSDYPKNPTAKRVLIAGQICILVAVGMVLPKLVESEDWSQYRLLILYLTACVAVYLLYQLYRRYQRNSLSGVTPSPPSDGPKLSSVTKIRSKADRASGKWIRRTESEIRSIKKTMRKSSLDPTMPVLLAFFISSFWIANVVLNLFFGEFLKSVFVAGVKIFFAALIIIYILQIFRGRSFMKGTKIRICNKCQREDTLGLKDCSCGGRYEPSEYFVFEKGDSLNL